MTPSPNSDSHSGSTPPASSPKALRFALGRVLVTPAAERELVAAEMAAALGRHMSGDWGDLCEEDVQQNEFAVDNFMRIFSQYSSQRGTKFWIITEADRSATTILLPDDY